MNIVSLSKNLQTQKLVQTLSDVGYNVENTTELPADIRPLLSNLDVSLFFLDAEHASQIPENGHAKIILNNYPSNHSLNPNVHEEFFYQQNFAYIDPRLLREKRPERDIDCLFVSSFPLDDTMIEKVFAESLKDQKFVVIGSTPIAIPNYVGTCDIVQVFKLFMRSKSVLFSVNNTEWLPEAVLFGAKPLIDLPFIPQIDFETDNAANKLLTIFTSLGLDTHLLEKRCNEIRNSLRSDRQLTKDEQHLELCEKM